MPLTLAERVGDGLRESSGFSDSFLWSSDHHELHSGLPLDFKHATRSGKEEFVIDDLLVGCFLIPAVGGLRYMMAILYPIGFISPGTVGQAEQWHTGTSNVAGDLPDWRVGVKGKFALNGRRV